MNQPTYKIFMLLLLAFFAGANSGIIAQESGDPDAYNAPQPYELGGIKVTGNVRADASTIISLSGLRIGSTIIVPGDDIQQAIKKLWKVKLFTQVDIYVDKTIGNSMFLEVAVKERTKLSSFEFSGIGKQDQTRLREELDGYLLAGTIVTENAKVNSINRIKAYFEDKGFYDAQVEIIEKEDPIIVNNNILTFLIDKKKKVKISRINFHGNEQVEDKKLVKMMKGTKMKRRFLAGSKFVDADYETDKSAVVAHYNSLGYRDAQILKDSLYRNAKNDFIIDIYVHEGKKYYLRNIDWKGNSIYDEKLLNRIFTFKKGDTYDNTKIEQKLRFSPDGSDVSSLYLDNGYLFFTINPVEVAIVGDSIDLEIQIFEGKKAIINNVVIKGNDRTHEHVIRRELRTRPGETFSRSAIIRTQRELMSLGFFNPENIQIETPVDPNAGTVDIIYTLEERSSDQLELSAGWGGRGRGVVGTLGVTFSNFSLRNVFNKSEWSPLPQGDGQRLSLRMQSNGLLYQSYNFSFTEPWLGGKKPKSFTVGGYHTRSRNSIGDNGTGLITLSGGSIGLGSRLKFPDDFFVANTSLSYKGIGLKDRTGFRLDDGTAVSNGFYNNVSLTQSISRNSIDDPIYPRNGSKFGFSVELTPPYSLLNKNKDYTKLDVEDKFKWLEYHKWKMSAEWYSTITGNLVFRARAKFGFLGYYNDDIGLSPFERFELGGDGLSQGSFIEAKEVISLRGYTTSDIGANASGGGSLYDKFSVELRYPFSLNPSSVIYGIAFLEGGNAWNKFEDFDPFNMKRSAGVGLRLFLPIFGTIGFDYGFGLDRQFSFDASAFDYAQFNIILGFEPE